MIEDIVTNVLQHMQISTDENLTGFMIDADYALGEQELFESVAVMAGDGQRSAVNAVLRIKDSVEMIQEVAQAFLQAWPEITYSEFSSFAIQRYIEGTVLRFVTAVPGGELCVTGTFIATSGRYGQLVERFNTDYGPMVGPVRAMPGGLPDWAR
jgi:hypothetical protein